MDVNTLTLARVLAQRIAKEMRGRICDEKDNAAMMATYAAVPGDHLEIGTLHGGTAVLVAMLKEALGVKGKVVCIDPLNGYYVERGFGKLIDGFSLVPVTPETVLYNADLFGVRKRIEIVQANSCPWPVVEGRRFATAYIDGDHWGDYPTRDWINCAACVDKFIVFDNVDDQHPAVKEAVNEAIQTPGWRLVLLKGITAVMEKTN